MKVIYEKSILDEIFEIRERSLKEMMPIRRLELSDYEYKKLKSELRSKGFSGPSTSEFSQDSSERKISGSIYGIKFWVI